MRFSSLPLGYFCVFYVHEARTVFVLHIFEIPVPSSAGAGYMNTGPTAHVLLSLLLGSVLYFLFLPLTPFDFLPGLHRCLDKVIISFTQQILTNRPLWVGHSPEYKSQSSEPLSRSSWSSSSGEKREDKPQKQEECKTRGLPLRQQGGGWGGGGGGPSRQEWRTPPWRRSGDSLPKRKNGPVKSGAPRSSGWRDERKCLCQEPG